MQYAEASFSQNLDLAAVQITFKHSDAVYMTTEGVFLRNLFTADNFF
jgi:hypothetical protein